MSAILSLAISTGCKEEPEGESVSIYQNIVTFRGNQGRFMTFDYQEIDDSPLVNLKCEGNIDQNSVPIGTRIILTYSPALNQRYDEGGLMTLRGIDRAHNALLTTVSSEEAQQMPEPIYVTTLYRSGPYINLTCKLPVCSKRKFTLKADESTITSGSPQLYISTETPEGPDSYNKDYYVSSDISALWKMPGTKSIIIHVNNSNNIYQKSFEFKKTL